MARKPGEPGKLVKRLHLLEPGHIRAEAVL